MEQMPKLDAPGKGLPFLHMLYARVRFGWSLSKKDTPEKNWKRFEKTNRKILDLVKNLSLEQMHKKVLVPKLPGIEDSSRYWSVADTLEHIEIVAESIAELLELLVKKEVPNKKVDIASYKPKGKYNGQDPRPNFEHLSKKMLERLSPLEIKHQKPYFNHPWLGNFSALQWQWLLSTHSGIHLNQILHIKQSL